MANIQGGGELSPKDGLSGGNSSQGGNLTFSVYISLVFI